MGKFKSHRYEKEIICPYCNYEHNDSWETENSGDYTCSSCNEDFFVEIEIDVTYSTFPKANKNEETTDGEV